MLNTKNPYSYLFMIGLVITASFVGNRFHKYFDSRDDEESELIRKYLLNDSPLYGFNKPKIWIHSKYEINARKWKNFYSRNTTDLNQPYIHLTVKTIINHCGDDFNICLIDDESFSKLIPGWKEGHMTTTRRELGMAQLLYIYGGIVLPNSFLCSRNLIDLYNNGTQNGLPFICENINRSGKILKEKQLFLPDPTFMGAQKRNKTIEEYVHYLKDRTMNYHFSDEQSFMDDTSFWCLQKFEKQEMNLVNGNLIGIKTQKNGKPILLEDLMEENYLDLNHDGYGIYVPAEEILRRTKYQWFAAISSEELFTTNSILVKYLKASIIDSTDEYHKKTGIIRSVVAI